MGFNTITMTKVQNEVKKPSTVLLDTLGQLHHEVGKGLLDKAYTPNQLSLQKRSRSKAISDAFIFPLIDVEGSTMTKSYWQTWRCTRIILQEGNKLSARYCDQRFCMVCNRIRTANLMRGYMPTIDGMAEPYLITLTHRTVTGRYLASTIKQDREVFNLCRRALNHQGIPTNGLRKTEVEVEEDGRFHAHIHALIDGKVAAEAMVEQWLKKHPQYTVAAAQDVRPLTDPHELFKYFTKMITKGKEGVVSFNPKQMDKVFTAMKGKRVFQPFGNVKKHVEEDIETNDQTTLDWRTSSEEEVEIWHFENAANSTDWYNAYGEPLAEVNSHIMDDKTLEYIEQIKDGSKSKDWKTEGSKPS